MSYSEPFFGEYNTLERRWYEIRDLIEINDQDSVLDMGCAEGWIAHELSKHVLSVAAFDIDREKIKKAKEIGDKPFFFTENILDYIKRDRYDLFTSHITLCLGLLHKIPYKYQLKVAEHCLMHTIRTVVFRFPGDEALENDILETASECKFLTFKQKSRYEDQGNILICRKFVPPI